MSEQHIRWLVVPFKEKERAKKIGAKWDPLVRSWWVPMYVPLASIPRHWLPEYARKAAVKNA